MKVWAHRDAWAPARTSCQDRINQSRISGSLLYKQPSKQKRQFLNSQTSSPRDMIITAKLSHICECNMKHQNIHANAARSIGCVSKWVKGQLPPLFMRA